MDSHDTQGRGVRGPCGVIGKRSLKVAHSVSLFLSPLSSSLHLGLMIKFLATRLRHITSKFLNLYISTLNLKAAGSPETATSPYKIDSPTQNTTIKKITATKIIETVNTAKPGVSHGITLQMDLYSLCQN